MNRRIEILKNIMAEILNYVLPFAIGAVFLADLAGRIPDMKKLMALVLAPVFFYGVRELCRHFSIFLLLQILPCIVLLLADNGDIVQRIWMFLVLAVFAGISLGKRLGGSGQGMEAVHPVGTGAVFFVLYLLDQKQGAGAWGSFLLRVGTVYAFGYLLYYFLTRFLHYIDMNNRTTENIPAKHVFWSASMLAGGFSLFTAGVMLSGSDRALLDRLGKVIHEAVIAFFTFLFSLIPERIEGEQQIVSEAPDMLPVQQMNMESVEPSVFVKILEAIAGIAVCVMVTGFLAVTLVSLVRFIRERFAQRNAVQPVRDEKYADQVERLERKGNRGRSRGKTDMLKGLERLLSPEERIRRIYRKALERELGRCEEKQRIRLSRRATPRECCMELFPEAGTSALKFAGLYEKARYGMGECSDEDVRRARKLSQKFHG